MPIVCDVIVGHDRGTGASPFAAVGIVMIDMGCFSSRVNPVNHWLQPFALWFLGSYLC